ncbi:MAG: hydantoinase B/oxoprolinase family protein [Alphaproteobacteria bacterium]|nr:hydantoinase B/oxoprolinase family protein [Alphaproteobacteria bacterium]
MTKGAETLDAVGLAIMWDRLVALTDEIVSTLVRTSFSTIVRESYDLTVVVVDADGRLMAQGSISAPPFIGTAPLTMKHVLRRFPPETLAPGDVIITNDPWQGTGHLFDVNVVRPVFRKGRIAGYTMSITHLPDIGGVGFGASAAEIYHEGLRIPLRKIVSAGALDESLLDLIRANVRVPEQVIGDVMANLTANEVGGRMLTEFMDEYGLADLDALSAAIRGQAERVTRARIRAMRPGRYTNRIQIEGIDAPITLACAIEIAGDGVTIDFAGTGACVPRGINVPYCYTNAMSLYSIKCLTSWDLPNNEGATAPIKVIAPEGCILNAQLPFPTGGRHSTGHFVSPLVFGAMKDAAPDLVQSDTGMIDILNFRGIHRNGGEFSTMWFSAGGFGAVKGHDGPNVTPGPSNMAVVPVEIWEDVTGTLIERKTLLTDSAGAGEARGGLGQEVVFRNDTGQPLTVFSMANRTEFPPLGFHAGRDGARRAHLINGKAIHPKGQNVLAPGDRLTLHQPGGGGFGDPKRRKPEQIRRDIAEGFVSREAAVRDYGAVIADDLGEAAE